MNTKASPPRRYRSNLDTLFAKGVDLSKDDKGRLPRTPLSPPHQPPPATVNSGLPREQGKVQRGPNAGGLGIITQGLRN